MAATSEHHRVAIVGGGSAGISVAARLARAGVKDVVVLDPSHTHYYQPLWTLVGGGLAPSSASARPQADLVPKGVSWDDTGVEGVDADNKTLLLTDGRRMSYDKAVIAPGIQLDWGKVPGMAEAMDTPWVSSNYSFELAPRTWELIRGMRRGTAVFTMPAGPIKCAGAPQKIAYLAADYWRKKGVLKDIRVVLVLPTPKMFGIPVFSDQLEEVARGYGIEVRTSSELVEVDPTSRSAVIADHAADSKESITYDLLHLVPPQSAPDWIKASPVADPENPGGYVQVDKHTMQHTRYGDVFALGDAGSTPNSKTGAAIRKQAPVVAANVVASLAGRPLPEKYMGYASCPLTVARDKLLLAEFDYTMTPTPSFKVPDTTKIVRDMGLFKRRGLPVLYWHLMLRGRA